MNYKMYVTKKPMNMVEGPVAPFIQKDPPRFYKTRKHWVAHTDDIIRNQSDNTQLIEDSVLAVSRDENQRRYGKRSYVPKVNKAFRPPLVDPEYDLQPLSRLNRPRTQARTNPESFAQAQNIHQTDVSAMIDERKLYAAVRPTFTIQYEKPLETILPDLKFNMPQVCADAGINTPIKSVAENPEVTLLRKNPEVYRTAGVESVFRTNGETPLENLQLDRHNPQVDANAGVNSNIRLNSETPLEDLQLDFNAPQTSLRTNVQSQYQLNHNNPSEYMNLEYNRPQASMVVNPNIGIDLQEKCPQEVNTVDRIKVPYKTTPDYGVRQTSFNENPTLKTTLQYDRQCGSAGVMPSNVQHLYPKLKERRNIRPTH